MFNNLRIFSVLAIMLMVSPSMHVYGDGGLEPPGAGEQIVGPPIEAVFTAYALSSNSVILVAGSCNKIPVAFFPEGPFTLALPLNGFSAITAETLEFMRFNGIAPAGCFSTGGGEDLIVTNVNKFTNNGFVAGAELSISAVQPKPLCSKIPKPKQCQ